VSGETGWGAFRRPRGTAANGGARLPIAAKETSWGRGTSLSPVIPGQESQGRRRTSGRSDRKARGNRRYKLKEKVRRPRIQLQHYRSRAREEREGVMSIRGKELLRDFPAGAKPQKSEEKTRPLKFFRKEREGCPQ